MFMIFGRSGRVHGPRINYVNFGDTQLLKIIQEGPRRFFDEILRWEFPKSWRSKTLEKMRVGNS